MISRVRNTNGLIGFIKKNNGLRDWAEKDFVKVIKTRFIKKSMNNLLKLDSLNHYIIACNRYEFPIASKILNDIKNDMTVFK